MTTYKRNNGKVQDVGYRKVFDAKGIRLINGARLLPRSPTLFDHFVYGAGAVNSHVPQNWVTTETGAATPYAPSISVEGGALVAVTGATTNNAEELSGKAVSWKPASQVNRPMTLEVRAKFVGATTPADGDFYIGFANASTYTNGLPYVFSAASAFTTSAPVEFAGFGYSSIPSSGSLFNASGNNFVGIVTEISSVPTLTVPATGIVKAKDSNFHIYRVEMDVNGAAKFFYDDAYYGSVNGAVTAATALTPYIVANCKASHAVTATIDYIFVGGELV